MPNQTFKALRENKQFVVRDLIRYPLLLPELCMMLLTGSQEVGKSACLNNCQMFTFVDVADNGVISEE